MKISRKTCVTVAAKVFLVELLLAVASQAQFPPRGDDGTTALGSFRIRILPALDSLMQELPGWYNSSTHRLNTWTQYDSTAIIGRSGPHLDGDASDLGGTPVGTAGAIISDADFSIRPHGFEGPIGTREVHTELRNMSMGYNLSIRIHAGLSAPSQPISPGETESKSPDGIPANDFPAESFFNLFLEMDLPAQGGFPGGSLYNPQALLMTADTLHAFPPKVIYVHQNPLTVPMRFVGADPGGAWEADDIVGYMVLAGLGVGYTDAYLDTSEFQGFMEQQEEMRLPAVPSLDMHGVILLLLLLVVSGLWIWRRERATATAR
jgi:hypothetical protein